MTGAPRAGRTSRLGAIAVGLAAAIALAGLVIVLFFNPLWVEAEQARARADLYTGFTPEQVRTVTADIIREVYLGPGTSSRQWTAWRSWVRASGPTWPTCGPSTSPSSPWSRWPW